MSASFQATLAGKPRQLGLSGRGVHGGVHDVLVFDGGQSAQAGLSATSVVGPLDPTYNSAIDTDMSGLLPVRSQVVTPIVVRENVIDDALRPGERGRRMHPVNPRRSSEISPASTSVPRILREHWQRCVLTNATITNRYPIRRVEPAAAAPAPAEDTGLPAVSAGAQLPRGVGRVHHVITGCMFCPGKSSFGCAFDCVVP